MKVLEQLKNNLLWKVQGDVKCQFPFGNCIIKYRQGLIEVWNPVKDTYLDNIAQYLMDCLEPAPEISIWDCNGFRNEADYLKYKYG